MTLFHQLTTIVDTYGAPGLFILVGLESLGLPLPGETAIITAAATAGGTKASVFPFVIAATLGAILGDNIGYFIGRRFGRSFIERHGGRIGATPQRFARVESAARRYGFWMVAGARFFVLLRQLNGIAAGTTGMHWATFFLSNTLGAILWVSLWTFLAYRFGETAASSILPWLWHHISILAGGLVFFVIVAIVLGFLRSRRKQLAKQRE